MKKLSNWKRIPKGAEPFLLRCKGVMRRLTTLGSYLEIDRPKRLVFTWGIEGESDEESVVSIDITSTVHGCRLTLVHKLDPKWAEYAERTKDGWIFMLDKLKEIAG